MLRFARLAFVLGVLLFFGCAYQVHVRGVSSVEAPADPITEATIAVQHSEDVESAAEITGKIERLLREQGFKIAPRNEADLLLIYEYERKGLLHKVVLSPIGGAATGMRTVRAEPPYNHSVVLRLVDGPVFRDQNKAEVYWAGEAVLNNAQTGSPKIIDLLLIAAFDHFPEDTESTIKVAMALENARARKLRR